jgi:hypothetical protein
LPVADPGAPPTTSVGAFGFASQAELDAALALLGKLRDIARKNGDMA